MIEYKIFGEELLEEAYQIYKENKWLVYLDNKDKLRAAFQNSQHILGAFDNGRLVGFIRCVGDKEYVIYVQDLIVKPSYQRQGIGRELMTRASNQFPNVRQFLLITDANDKDANAFYQEIGMSQDFMGYPINTYFRKK